MPLQALMCRSILWLLPHFAAPGGFRYPVPLASLAMLAALVHLAATLRLRIGDRAMPKVRRRLARWYVWLACSALYGQVLLQRSGADVLALVDGPVLYWQAALQRMVQVALAIAAFEIVRTTRVDAPRLMRWWLQGTCVAVALHAAVYVASSDYLALRAGTFVEGNHGGLYYLLSLFVALDHHRLRAGRGSRAAVGACLLGLLLTQSSAAMIVLLVALAARQLAVSRDLGSAVKRQLLLLAGAAIVIPLLLAVGADFGTLDKLFEEDVTAASFSRIDRLLAIENALDLFLASPIVGHGVQSFGFLANDYLSGPLAQVYDWSFRRIPNNIYAELLSETGIVGLLLLLVFIGGLILRSRRPGHDPGGNFLAGLTALLVYWLAFPTYSLVFIWVYFALVHRGAATHALASQGIAWRKPSGGPPATAVS